MLTRLTPALAGMGLLLLAGCDEGGLANTNGPDPAADAAAAASSDSAVALELLPPSAAMAPPTGSVAIRVQTPAVQQIAYSYRYALETPGLTATDLMRRHEAACRAAGPAQCQVLSSSAQRMGKDAVLGQLEIRAAPVWLDRFRAALAGDAERAGGRVTRAATDSEDLTRSLSDTGARLRALTTLRDRLQTLLATRSAPLDQLLATERELARVQGELDATQSALTAMQTRVAMSEVSLEYQTTPSFVSEGVFAPVSNALHGSLGIFMGSLGGLIYFVAGALPFALIIVPLIWWGLRWRRKTRLAKAGKAAASPDVKGPDA